MKKKKKKFTRGWEGIENGFLLLPLCHPRRGVLPPGGSYSALTHTLPLPCDFTVRRRMKDHARGASARARVRMMCNALRYFNHSLLLLRSALIAALLSAPSRLVKLCWHFTSFLVLGKEKNPNHFQRLFFVIAKRLVFYSVIAFSIQELFPATPTNVFHSALWPHSK